VDFRSVCATLLARVPGSDPGPVLDGYSTRFDEILV
jgi:hypothetical protein